MFPPEIIAGTAATSVGETTEEREKERIRSEQWRLSTDNQGTDYGNNDAQLPSPSSSSPPLTAVPLRRVHSEYMFQFSDEANLITDVGSPATSGSFERVKDEDDLLASFMDFEKIESVDIADQSFPEGNDEDQNDNGKNNLNLFRRCRSAGDMCGSLIDNGNSNNKKAKDGTCEVKKAMSPDKLAELWILDPKRAKRILANRQSAARSKERKALYIVELEKRVQTLRTEATALSVQLSLFERDTSGLTNENTELRRQLESMEQHAQLRDALIDALKQEIERLKVATGETTAATDTFIMHVQNIPQPQSQSQSQPQTQPLLVDSSQPKLPLLYSYESSMSNPNHVDLHRPQMSHLPSFELNIQCNHALERVRTKKSRTSPPEQTLPSLQQAAVDTSNMKSQPMHTFDPSLLNLPQPAKVSSLHPLETGLYIPSLDSSKHKMPQFCTTEINMHAPLQPSQSTHGSLLQEPFETNFLNRSSQWAGPGRSRGVLDRSGLVPVGHWAV